MENNIKKLEDLAKQLKSLSLTRAERTQIRLNIVSRLEGVSKQDEARLTFKSRLINYISFRYMPIALAIALFFGGGVSYAAAGSLPGDILYPVKTGVNERVKVAFAFSDEAKARVQAQLAERRLEEAETLVVEGRLNAETRAEVETRFASHSEAVEERVVAMQKSRNLVAAAEVSAEFESSINAHKALLGQLLTASAQVATSAGSGTGEAAADNSTVVATEPASGSIAVALQSEIEAETSSELKKRIIAGTQTEGRVEASGSAEIAGEGAVYGDGAIQVSAPQLLVRVGAESDSWAGIRSGIEAKVSAQADAGLEVSARKKLETVVQKIVMMRNLLEQKKNSLGAEIYAEAEARISVADSLVIEARAQLENKEYGRVFGTLVNAESILIETRVFINVSNRIKVDLKFNGDVKSGVSTRGDSGLEAKGGARVDGVAGARVTLPSYQGLRDQIYENRVEINIPNVEVRSRLQPISPQFPSVDIQSELKVLQNRGDASLRTGDQANFNFENRYQGNEVTESTDANVQIDF